MHYSLPLLIAGATASLGCTIEQRQPTPVAASASAGQSLLASSNPADGAVVAGPVDKLELRFSRPARLSEVTVTAADGTIMPMMVTAVGEVLYYSLPLQGLRKGSYTVAWKASSAGTDYQGELGFEVR